MPGSAGIELLRRGGGPFRIPRCEVDVDEQGHQRRGGRASRLELHECPFEHVTGARGLPLRQMDGRQRPGRLDVGRQSVTDYLARGRTGFRELSRGQPRPCQRLLGAACGLQRWLGAKKCPQVAGQLDGSVVVVPACCRGVLLLADFAEQNPQLANMLRADHHATLINRRDRVAHTAEYPHH